MFQMTFGKLKMGEITFYGHLIYIKIKQHTYSNLYLLKYIKQKWTLHLFFYIIQILWFEG